MKMATQLVTKQHIDSAVIATKISILPDLLSAGGTIEAVKAVYNKKLRITLTHLLQLLDYQVTMLFALKQADSAIAVKVA